MARGAGALRAIRIDAPDAAVGPGGGIKLAPGQHLDLGPMALPAPGGRRGGDTVRETAGDHAVVALDHLGEGVVERAEDAPGLGVAGVHELLDLLGVAAG